MYILYVEKMENRSEKENLNFVAGLCLAVSSSLFIGSSFIIKKIALKNLYTSGHLRAASGGFSYLKNWVWWLGLITMGVGEITNLCAYGLVPAALVTPLGALSILVTAILASQFLNEKLNTIGKIGCSLCVLGSIVFVIHSPKSVENESLSELISKISNFAFISYVIIIIVVCCILKLIFIPKFGNTNITVYLFMCSGIGSLTIVACKAVVLGVKETLNGGNNNFTSYSFWLLCCMAVITVMIQMNYLNKSLDIFNTNIVTPVYYVMFTILVVIATGILFKEWEHMDGKDILGCGCGFLIVIIAVCMLNAFKDVELTSRDQNLFSQRRRFDPEGDVRDF